MKEKLPIMLCLSGAEDIIFTKEVRSKLLKYAHEKRKFSTILFVLDKVMIKVQHLPVSSIRNHTARETDQTPNHNIFTSTH